MGRPVCVAVVSPFEIIRVGIAQLLRTRSDEVQLEDVVAQNGHLASLDVVLYDLAAGDIGDLAHLTGDNCAVIGITHDHLDSRTTRAAMRRLGVDDTISVRETADHIVDKILNVASGIADQPTSSETGGDAEGDAGSSAGVRSPWAEHGLSRRETQILAGIAAGLSNQEIAEHLYLSINSVKTYIRTAYPKIGVSTRSQAVAWAFVHGFDDLGAAPES